MPLRQWPRIVPVQQFRVVMRTVKIRQTLLEPHANLPQLTNRLSVRTPSYP